MRNQLTINHHLGPFRSLLLTLGVLFCLAVEFPLCIGAVLVHAKW